VSRWTDHNDLNKVQFKRPHTLETQVGNDERLWVHCSDCDVKPVSFDSFTEVDKLSTLQRRHRAAPTMNLGDIL
jgi:hypothetical protein